MAIGNKSLLLIGTIPFYISTTKGVGTDIIAVTESLNTFASYVPLPKDKEGKPYDRSGNWGENLFSSNDYLLNMRSNSEYNVQMHTNDEETIFKFSNLIIPLITGIDTLSTIATSYRTQPTSFELNLARLKNSLSFAGLVGNFYSATPSLPCFFFKLLTDISLNEIEQGSGYFNISMNFSSRFLPEEKETEDKKTPIDATGRL